MAFTLIAHDAASNSNSASVTPNAGGNGINTTGANLLIAIIGQAGANAAVISDAIGIGQPFTANTWTTLTRYGTLNTTATIQIAYVLNGNVGANHKFKATASGSAPALAVLAFAGAGSFDTGKDAGAASASASSQQPGSLTPSEDNCLVITGFITNVGTSAPTVDSPFTVSDALGLNTGTSEGVGGAYDIQTTATARNPTWTRQTTGSATMAAALAVFKSAPPLTITGSDQFSFSDAFTSQLLFALSLSDSLSISDAFARAFGEFGLTLSDSVSLSDAVRILNNELSLSLSDALSLSDSMGDRVSASLGLGDLLNFTDALRLAAALRLASSEVLALTDAIVLARNAGLSLSDTITLSDAVVTQLNNNLQLQISDTITLSDALSILTSTSFINYLRRYLNDVQR